MKLSVIIVSYNVKYFLEQCLLSVKRATEKIEAEVFVVDNASADSSVEEVKQKFPFVKIIANTKNAGFAKANNQAISVASGEYVLLLNPDTVVAEDTFEKCIAFMDNHPEAGALGVKMIDGKGNFLPESKRGLPTPSVAFYKTFGLSKLFPKSKTFGKYHLGYLNEHETHEVEVLSGAFLFIRQNALQKTSLLDENFFMYGEDIDLSYRITQSGYKNYYFPETTIIHYKGESTKKGSLNYVRIFYQAMLIFSRKHFSASRSRLFSLLINCAIVFRALLTLLANLFASSYLFLVDAALSFCGIYFLKTYWENNIKYSERYYPNEFLFIVVPIYILIWLVASFFSGGYDKPFRSSDILRGILFGTIVIAVVYAFIPNEWRFSRAIIILGAAWTGFEMLASRTIYHLIIHQSFSVDDATERKTLIVGKSDAERAGKILRALGNTREILFSEEVTSTRKTLAMYDVNEIIFCSRDYSFREIIQQIAEGRKETDYKILNESSHALIGSNSKETSGDLYVAEKNYTLFKKGNQRGKRVFDLSVCFLLLTCLPFNIFVIKNPGRFISNWLEVLLGRKSWVGFTSELNLGKFRHAKPGILHPSDRLEEFELSERDIIETELNYARHYSKAYDLHLLLKNFKKLGQ